MRHSCNRFVLLSYITIIFTTIVSSSSIILRNTRRFSSFLMKSTSSMEHSNSVPSSNVPLTSVVNFDNRNLISLPIDESLDPGSRKTHNTIFSLCNPTPVNNPQLVCYSRSALKLLNIDAKDDGNGSVGREFEQHLAEVLSGNKLLEGSKTYSHCYCGHQFGSFAGQLGDGAAIYLGEVLSPSLTPEGFDRHELQLKGAGPTPFSRSSDGRKVLRSSIREFLCSEAMHFLGIPTTRAAACVTSDTRVARDPMYDGNVIQERCTVVSRISPSFFRFGSFEIFIKTMDRVGPSEGNAALKEQLLDYILENYFSSDIHDGGYKAMYNEIVKRTAKLVAQWQGVGFVHGVLNTDNMSMLGLTIDYGPFGFMEYFDPDFVPNGSDSSGRYSYEKQPEICKWNLKKLAEALAPLLPESDSSTVLATYDEVYNNEYMTIMNAKLGLGGNETSLNSTNKKTVEEFFNTMQSCGTDFTGAFQAFTFYRQQGLNEQNINDLATELATISANPLEMSSMIKKKMKISRLSMPPEQIEGIWQLCQSDPARIESMFNAPVGDIKREIQGEKEKLDRLISCSEKLKMLESLSKDDKLTRDKGIWINYLQNHYMPMVRELSSSASSSAVMENMQAANPTFILKNWIAQDAIESADGGDYSKVRKLLSMLETPFSPSFSSMRDGANSLSKCNYGSGGNNSVDIDTMYCGRSPSSSNDVICTCSS